LRSILFISICLFSIAVEAKGIEIFIDDSQVQQDTYYPGCSWKHCKKKAKKLKNNVLKSYLSSKLTSVDGFYISTSAERDFKDGLKITIFMKTGGSGRGYAEFASGLLTLGAAPLKVNAKFEVKYETFKNGKVIKSKNHEFMKKRNISVLADTQKYKKKAANVIFDEIIRFYKENKT